MNMFLDSILLWPQDCSLQSCCGPRIEGNSTRNSTRAATKKMVGACLHARLTRQPTESYGSYGSYGHTVIRRLGCATLPRLPGIEASGLPAPHRSRNSDFAFLPEKPITGPAPKVREICCPRSITPGVFFFPSPGQRRRSVSEAVLVVPLTECFFHHSHAQPSILAWAQDCPTQSWRGHRIAPLNPGVGTGLPHSILAWQQECPGASRAARAWNCSSPSAGL